MDQLAVAVIKPMLGDSNCCSVIMSVAIVLISVIAAARVEA